MWQFPHVTKLLGLTRWWKRTIFSEPSSFQGANTGLLPSIDALPASRVLRGMQWVTWVAGVSRWRQRRAVPQLSLGGIHDRNHPVPGGNQLFLHKVLFLHHGHEQPSWCDNFVKQQQQLFRPKVRLRKQVLVASWPHLQADCVVIGKLHGSRVLRVDKVVVLGDETHEVRDLPDDDAVRPGQAAGWGQIAAGVAGLQGSGCRRSAGANGTGATQVGGINVYETSGACWKKWK